MNQRSESPIPLINTEKQLESCLVNLLTPNNQKRKNIEFILKRFCSNPKCILAFTKQIQISSNPTARQMACVLMRAKIKTTWEYLEHQENEYVKKSLLDCFYKEPFPIVRIGIVNVIGEIAIFELPNDTWKELGPFMMNSVKNTNIFIVEAGIILFGVLLEKVPIQMKRNLNIILNILLKGLKDRNENIQSATLTSLEWLIKSLTTENEMSQIKIIIPDLFKLFGLIIKTEKTNMLATAFSIFDEFAEIRSNSLREVFPNMVIFMLKIASNNKLHPTIRERACTFIGNSQIILDFQLLGKVMNLCGSLLLSPETVQQFTEDEEITNYKTGVLLLDQTCNKIPSHFIFNKLVNIALNLMKVRNPAHTRAGVTILGIIAEGMYEKTKENLGKFLSIMEGAYNSNNIQIRFAGITGIINYSEYCQPEILNYHAKVMPILLRGLNDENYIIRERVCNTIDSFCVQLGSTIIPYAEKFLKSLFEYFKIENFQLISSAISSISAISEALKENFIPFFPKSLQVMKFLISKNNKNENTIMVKGKAIECIGILAKSVGAKNFGNFVEVFMKLILQGFEEVDDCSYRENSFSCIQNFAYTFGENFSRYLNVSLSFVYQSIQTSPSELVRNEDQSSFLDSNRNDSVEELDTSEYSIESVTAEFLMEKSRAISCLGQLGKSCRLQFKPYFQKSINILVNLLSHFHPDIKKRVVVALTGCVVGIIPLPIPSSPSSQNKNITTNLMNIFNGLLVEEESKDVVMCVCDSITTMLCELGTLPLMNLIIFENLLNNLYRIFNKNAECFKFDLKDNMNTIKDHDYLYDHVCTLISNIAETIGPDFEKYYGKFFPILLSFLSDKRTKEDKILGIGTLADVCKSLKEKSAPYSKKVLFECLKNFKQNNYLLQQNCVFGIGIIFYNDKNLLKEIAAQQQNSKVLFDQSLNLISYVLSNSIKFNPIVVDNTCAALSRILIVYSHLLPVAKVFPLLLNNLPLKKDFEENKVVFECILKLLNENNQFAMMYLQKILKLFSFVLNNSQRKVISEELRGNIIKMIQQLKKKMNFQNKPF